MFLLPASLMTRWNSQFLHMLTHGQGWVGEVGMMTFLSLAHMWHAMDLTFLALAHMWHATRLTFLALAHMWHATQVMGRVGWVGWGWCRFFHLHTCDMLRTWRFLHLHTCDMLWTWKSESKRRSVKFASVSHNKCSLQSGTLKLDWQGLKR